MLLLLLLLLRLVGEEEEEEEAEEEEEEEECSLRSLRGSRGSLSSTVPTSGPSKEVSRAASLDICEKRAKCEKKNIKKSFPSLIWLKICFMKKKDGKQTRLR